MISDKPLDLKRWLKDTAWHRLYWSKVRERAKALDSDGCSGVPDWMIWTCYEHDIHYRTHRFLDGKEITRAKADRIMRVRMQQGSAWGVLYWRSWARWIGVRLFGANAWNKKEEPCATLLS